jgi:hypothetical protein
VLRELQWIGDDAAVAAIGGALADAKLCATAAAALLAIAEDKATSDKAAEQLRAAWPKAEGTCRLTVLHALATLRDGKATGIFREAIGAPDVDLRLTAAWALAQVADAGSAASLLKLADAEPSFERIKAAGACMLMAERLAAAGRKDAAAHIYLHLRDSRTAAHESHLRDSAGKALQGLSQ